MDLYTIHYVKSNQLVYNYLREDSSWYNLLNRDSSNLKEVEEAAKKFYGMRVEDRIKRISDKIDTVSSYSYSLNAKVHLSIEIIPEQAKCCMTATWIYDSLI